MIDGTVAALLCALCFLGGGFVGILLMAAAQIAKREPRIEVKWEEPVWFPEGKDPRKGARGSRPAGPGGRTTSP